jgi:hypothetical protein
MIVEANCVVMTGRQLTAAGAGVPPTTSPGPSTGTAVMPIKKRKVETRASLEVSRASIDFATRVSAPYFSLRNSRGSTDSRRPSLDARGSVDARRPSLEVRVSYDVGHASLDVSLLSCDPAGQGGTVLDLDEDIEMEAISENNSNEAVVEAEVTRTTQYRRGGFMGKMFGLQRPSCVKVRKDDNIGFIVNKRFMDLVDRRNKLQKSQLEQLQRENEALRNANNITSSNYLSLLQQHRHSVLAPQSQEAVLPVQHQFMFAQPTAQHSTAVCPWQSMSYKV